MSSLQIIGDLLREYMRMERLTQRELAGRCSKEVSYINKILQGQVNLTIKTIEEIEGKLGISLIAIPVWRDVRERQIVKDYGSEVFNYPYAIAA